MTVTTLGSNIIPVTSIGKVSTAIVAITGITIFPIFTVYITTMIQDWKTKEKEKEQAKTAALLAKGGSVQSAIATATPPTPSTPSQ